MTRARTVSEVHAQESHCPYFPFDQACEKEREKENARSEICVIWYKNITVVLTDNLQQEGSRCEPLRCACLCEWLLVAMLALW